MERGRLSVAFIHSGNTYIHFLEKASPSVDPGDPGRMMAAVVPTLMEPTVWYDQCYNEGSQGGLLGGGIISPKT